ncbi:hypothetical protein GCM10022240_24310 [Microbacterium kribbense]|uniref:Alanine racemase C-terminal domain-containing protein n=1 Tax=Microbacterium kribbense TaxID=433645 RepID=A0ABP7GNW1_9MICO
MTGPDRAPHVPSPVRTVISHAALRHNAQRLIDRAPGRAPLWADLRRDAWGHGLTECAQTLTEAGMRILTDADADAAGDADVVDPAALWGFAGAGCRPVMSLYGSVLSVKPLLAGEGVSYGYTFRAAVDTTVGLVGGGYAQGIVRELGNRVRVQVGGALLPVIGRVAMDACVVDLQDTPAAAGCDVCFFGDPGQGRPALADWCAVTGLTAGEITTLAGARATRRHER